MKNFVFIILAFALGYIAAQLIPSKSPESLEPMELPSEPVKNEAKEKLQKLTDTDIAEYYRLKTMEERYKKADEILGKIMNIFLADLGLRISKQTLDLAKEPPPPPVTSSSTVSSTPAPTPVSEPDPTPPPTPQKKAPQANIENVRSMGDVASFLEKVRLQNLEPTPENLTSLRNQAGQLEEMNGRFAGAAQVFINNKMRVWNMDFTLNGRIDNNQFGGRLRIRISENGKVFSNLQENGTIRAIKESTQNANDIFIRAAPTTYLQVYYAKNLDALVGNIYREVNNKFVPIGSFHLARRR